MLEKIGQEGGPEAAQAIKRRIYPTMLGTLTGTTLGAGALSKATEEEKPSEDQEYWKRMLRTGLMSGTATGLANIIEKKPSVKSMVLSALAGGTAQGLGDSILGKGDEDSMLSQAARGALGGGIVGGGLGVYGMGSAPGGSKLIKAMMQRGLSKNAALALALGTGGALGAASQALMHGGSASGNKLHNILLEFVS